MHMNFRFELKSLAVEGSFEGVAAVYGNVDLGGDVIEPGAFSKSLTDKGGEVPILWQHDSREPIGLGKLSDSREGLLVKGELALESPAAQKAYGLLKLPHISGKNRLGRFTVRRKTIRKRMRAKLLEIKHCLSLARQPWRWSCLRPPDLSPNWHEMIARYAGARVFVSVQR